MPCRPRALPLDQVSLREIGSLVDTSCAAAVLGFTSLPFRLVLLLRVLVEHKVGEILRITQLTLHIEHD